MHFEHSKADREDSHGLVVENLKKIGRIEKGHKANLIFVDEWFDVKKTLFDSEIV